MTESNTNAVVKLLNGLLGLYWAGMAQHQSHLALVESWGLAGLAAGMQAHIADEPVTLKLLADRLLELDGDFEFTLGTPNIGKTLADVLENDMAAQKRARPGLNQAAELAASQHDATTRQLIEGILLDEEAHLDWLKTELDLYKRLGEPLYVANRLALSGSTTSGPVA